ncbi:MAG: hypothetical protein AAGG72_03745, partial [Pseudomonadota bacterium]
PTRFAPTNNLQRSQERAATVVRLMKEQGYLSEAELPLREQLSNNSQRAGGDDPFSAMADFINES